MRKSAGYWTKEHCMGVALACKTRSEFNKNYVSAYNNACKYNWLDEICSHMQRKIKPNGYWTKERCHEMALKCKTKTEFENNYSAAYSASWKNGWYYEICSHMIEVIKPSGYWTKEHCHEVALKCKTRSEFQINYSGAYTKSKKCKFIDEICSHMIPQGNLRKRIVYSYEFSNNYVYVGITCNENKRNNAHLTYAGAVFDHINKYNLTPVKKILSNGYIEVIKAQELEKFYVEKYKNDGWGILNKVKTGGLGGNTLFWTKENCYEAALKCNTRKELSLKYIGAYVNARKNKWLDDICGHMIWKRRNNGYWTYEKCKEVALNCFSRFDYSRKYSGAHYVSNKNGWLNDFYPITRKEVFI
jgi:hypothetical protein